MKSSLSIPLIGLCLSNSAFSALLFQDRFEQHSLSGLQLTGSKTARVSNSAVRAGNYSVEFTLDRHAASVPYRSEVRLMSPNTFNIGSEYWYGFSIFIPDNWATDSSGEILAQWHNTPDAGEAGGSPPLALSVSGATWFISNKWDSERVAKKRGYDGSVAYSVGTVGKGEWTDWVFHIKWSYQGKDGLLEVWKNGKRVVQKHGPNTFNDAKGPYFKFGIYKWDWRNPSGGRGNSKVSKRVVYHDTVRVGDHGASYGDVAP